MTSPTIARIATGHPLDPLSAPEITLAVDAVKAEDLALVTPSFFSVVVEEPTKQELRAAYVARRARVGLVDRSTGVIHELVVRLPDRDTSEPAARIEHHETIEGAQPPIVGQDFAGAAAAVLADPRFVAALERRGITDLSLVQVDPLSPGSYPQNPVGRRILWATPFVKTVPASNAYAKPVENLRAAVDINSLEVLEVIDDDPIIPLSTADGEYATAEEVGGWRDDIAPLQITQPDGPGFTLDGHELAWQDWRLHVQLHPVDGLILSALRFVDGGRERSVAHRLNLAEMVVPYGDPHAGFYWRNYFDAGEYGMGRCTNSLTNGCDCLGEIRYLDGVMVDAAGEPETIENAICIHEEDVGVLWKHTNPATGEAQVRRARRLVVSHFATVGNYDYGFYWSLYQDGTIELEVKLTGIVLTRGVTPDQVLAHASRVAPDLAAPHHQHVFNVRMDMAVDGDANTVYEVDLVASDAGPDNPWDQAVEVRSTPITRESEGRRQIQPAAQRKWKVVNPGVRNAIGEPVGYALMPHNGPTLLASPTSSVGKRAAFASSSLWVTKCAPGELHPAGDYPGQHPGGAGLPAFQEADRDLVDTDVVLWHSFGVSHAVRTEDWPIMPVERLGFALRPSGFFDRNPAVHVPPSTPVTAGVDACCGA